MLKSFAVRFRHIAALGLTGSLALGGCKTSGSSTKDAQTDGIKAALAKLPPGLISRNVPTDGIERAVAPADGKNGLPDSLTGIWWTDAKSINYALSFQTSFWNASTHTLSLLYSGPGQYTNPDKNPEPVGTELGGNFIAGNYLYGLKGYDIVFSDDLKSGKLYDATSPKADRTRTDTGYTMTWESDGVWVRHTPGNDDYRLRRIVTKDGKRTGAYAKFLQSFGPKSSVIEAVNKIGKSSPQVTIDVGGSEPTLVDVDNTSFSDPSNLTQSTGNALIEATGNVAVTLRTTQKDGVVLDRDVDGKHVLAYAGENGNTILLVKSKGGAGKVTLKATPLVVARLSEEQPTATVTLVPGIETIVMASGTYNASGNYQLSVDASSPAYKIRRIYADTWTSGPVSAHLFDVDRTYYYLLPTAQGGQARLTFKKVSDGDPNCVNNGGQGFGSLFGCFGFKRCRKDDGVSFSAESTCVPAS